jgi:Tol biopolymer transport system component
MVSVSSAGTQGNRYSFKSSISADGQFIAFNSDAFNLVKSDTNERSDVFVRDLTTHTTRRVSLTSTGAEGGSDIWSLSISADGRFVAFDSWAPMVEADTNRVADVFVRGPLS